MPNISIETVTTAVDLQSLQEIWNSLSTAARHPNVFTTFDWFRVWNQRATDLDTQARRRLNVLVLKAGKSLAGISPLICRKVSRFGLAIRKIEFLESPADYNDLLVGDDNHEHLKPLISHLEQTQADWDVIDLRSLRDTGDTMAVLEQALSTSTLRYRTLPEALCPYLPIDAEPSRIVGRLSPSTRRNLRNRQRRLERMSAKGFRIRIVEHPESEPSLVDKFIELESGKRIQGEAVAPLFGDARHVFQSLFDSLGPRGWLYAALMELEDQLIAFQLGFRCGGALWDFSKAYDPAYSQLAPGTMLLPAVLEYGFSHGYREYDFLRGDEPYKMRWSTGSHQTYRLIIWNRRRMSRLKAFLYLDLKSAIYSALDHSRH